ncbi:sirohydrochlorin chelatase [Kyrpidia sp.]|uniref:sirohydrochlorin chelatase n=1 Tax=Kyrpidia sp. TaxID=2073077 RepID=UPI0025859E75|nr:sirohydrochlorin chelatase [Kyrpidia sp.]MCL6576476.1 sirohydrochlorin chelatase [Kyrpidia sp.]
MRMENEQGAVLLIGHGSRDPEGNREFSALVENLRHRWPDRTVAGAFLEMAEPGIPHVMERLAARGIREVWAIPVILLPARHVREEIPEILARSAREWGVRVRYGRPLGLHPGVLDMLVDRLAEAAGEWELSTGKAEGTAVVFVGRGSSNTEANGQLYRLARLFWEKCGADWVEPCFVGVTYPDVPTALRRAVLSGVRRVVVLPYLLFTGVLMKRLAGWVEEAQAEMPEVEFRLARYLAGHPKLEDIVAGRLQELMHEMARGGDGDGEDFRRRVWAGQ